MLSVFTSRNRVALIGVSILGLSVAACSSSGDGGDGSGGDDGGGDGGTTTTACVGGDTSGGGGRTWSVEQISGALTTVAANTSPGTNRVSITVSADVRTIAANNVPDHNVGTFSTGSVQEQNNVYTLDATPTLSGGITCLELGDMFGVAVNGVTFDPLAAEYYEKGGRAWNYVVLNGAIQLRPDAQFGHLQSDEYHYHGIPQGLLDNVGYSAAAHSPLIGYAADGFPIYALTDSSGTVTPSYQVKSGSRPGGDEAPGGTYDGTFHGDYEYVDGLGSLDECNGKTTSGPDGNGGTYTGYAYFLTSDYPVIPLCLKGVMSANMSAASLFEPCREASCAATSSASSRQDAGAMLTAHDQALIAREGLDHLSDRTLDGPTNEVSLRLSADGLDASASLTSRWVRVRRSDVSLSEAALVGDGEGTFSQVSVGQDLIQTPGTVAGVFIGAEQGDWQLGSESDVAKDGITVGLYGGQNVADGLHLSGYVAATEFDNEMTSPSGASASVASTRTLASMRLQGEIVLESGLTLRPALEVGAGEEQIAAYTYSDGTQVPADEVGFTSVKLGSTVALPVSANQSQIRFRAFLEQLAATSDVQLSDGTILVASDQTTWSLGVTWQRELDEDRTLSVDLEVSGLGSDGEENASLALDYEGAF